MCIRDRKYIYEFGVNETKVEKELRLHSFKEHSTTSHLQISPDQSEFLKIIIKLGNYKNILELGTYLGYSTLGMALTTSGTITTIDKDDQFVKKAFLTNWSSLSIVVIVPDVVSAMPKVLYPR